MIHPANYYSRVGLELGKIIFEQRKMSPPYAALYHYKSEITPRYTYTPCRSLATFQLYFQPVLNALRHPATLFTQATTTSSTLQPTQILNRVRNLSNAQLASAAVVTAEVIGFFSVGEMLGRFKIIGYRSNEPAHH